MMTDKQIVDRLVDFVRTPEWSVSMMEDIAAIVREGRQIGDDLKEGDPRIWYSH